MHIRALHVLLGVAGLLFVALAYPLLMFCPSSKLRGSQLRRACNIVTSFGRFEEIACVPWGT